MMVVQSFSECRSTAPPGHTGSSALLNARPLPLRCVFLGDADLEPMSWRDESIWAMYRMPDNQRLEG